jgi:Ca-activated chloride channel family protein
MSRWNEHNVARKLKEYADEPIEPPKGLLEKIQAEIPSPLPAPANLPADLDRQEREDRTGGGGPRRWLIAASLVAMVGAGLFGLQVFGTRNKVSDERAEETAGPVNPANPANTVSPETARRSDAGVLVGGPPPGESKPSGPEPSLEEKQAAITQAGQSVPTPELLTRLGYPAPPPPPSPPAPAKPSPPNRQRYPGSPAQPIEVDGGVEGGVVGGVIGGVAGGVPGGVVGGVPSSARAEAVAGYAHDESPSKVGGTTGGIVEPNDEPYGDNFFESAGTNPFIDTEDDRLSTFGLDVDTGSYTVARRYLNDGNLPRPDSIRVEEFLNFFHYRDPLPASGDFALRVEGAPSPWTEGERYRMVRFSIRGREVKAANRKPAVLTFVVDVSGSMDQENRLGLVKQSLVLLLNELQPGDKVGLVVYGDAARLLQEPSSDKAAVRRAIEALRPEGATNAEAGLSLGYDVASRNYRAGEINRIVLCSDGVANVGLTGASSILQRIGREARRGIELTTLGFGMGNYNDVLMEQIANKGDGRYAYIDDIKEAERVLVEELTGTLQTIAKDAKAQVEFNPNVVSRYRLLGYENRDIADERFRDDSVDAGEIGAGHSVTALYEIKLQPDASERAELATLHLRYREPDGGEVLEVEKAVRLADFADSWEQAPAPLRLATVVGEFAEILKKSYWAKNGDLENVFRRAQRVSADFSGDKDVAELVDLIGKAARIKKGGRGE